MILLDYINWSLNLKIIEIFQWAKCQKIFLHPFSHNTEMQYSRKHILVLTGFKILPSGLWVALNKYKKYLVSFKAWRYCCLKHKERWLILALFCMYTCTRTKLRCCICFCYKPERLDSRMWQKTLYNYYCSCSKLKQLYSVLLHFEKNLMLISE